MKQKKNKVRNRLIYFLILTTVFTSCGPSKRINTDYIYFNDGSDVVKLASDKNVIQPNDLLSIQIYSRTLNQEQAAIFNIPANANNLLQGYRVNREGNIEMPVIGDIKAAGLTKSELQKFLSEKLSDNVKNPSVFVKFLQFNVNVLGEVHSPGIQKFNADNVNIIDAISSAGDLTDYGSRENIKVIRQEGNQKKVYIVDLRNSLIFDSPVFNLQPDDIVYISPNASKLKALNVDQDKQRKTVLFFTIFSAFISVASLIIISLR